LSHRLGELEDGGAVLGMRAFDPGIELANKQRCRIERSSLDFPRLVTSFFAGDIFRQPVALFPA
jgi:hypothetical protein